MSCIIGLKHGNSVYIGADSAATTEEGDIRPIKVQKIIRKNNFLIGFAGSVRTGQALNTDFFEPPDDVYELVEYMRQMFEQLGCLVTAEGNTSMSQSCFIIAHNGNLYEMLSDFQLNEIAGNFTAIGSGTPYAFAALDILSTMDLSPSEIITESFKVVSKYQATVRDPWVVEKY
jgi:ATP-dependent protease HslVU (ClpYQ) peptidase subunit